MSAAWEGRPDIGVVLGSSQAPRSIVAAAKAAERSGFDEIWVGEDYFYTGAIAVAGVILAETALPVGIGIVPTASRHPALLAMEIATLAEFYPGRLSAGVGGGVPDWLDAMGIRQKKLLSGVRDSLTGLRTLLAGEMLDTEVESYSAHEIQLAHPPAQIPPLYAGVGGPKSLQMAGQHADGTVLSVLAGPKYVRWAVEQLKAGGASDAHRVVVYALCSMDADATIARERIRELFGLYLLTSPRNPMTEVQGIADEAEALATLDFETAVSQIPDEWIDRLAIVGTPADCAKRLLEFGDAGADAVVFGLAPGEDDSAQVQSLAAGLIPELDALRPRRPQGAEHENPQGPRAVR